MDNFTDGVISGLIANKNNGAGDFGGYGGWIWIVLLFVVFFGWGGNGWGNRGNTGGGGSAVDGYVLTSDFANLERKLDGVNNGLCDGFYAMNTGMLNGFAGITSAITSSGYETRSAIADLSAALQSCCCNLRESIASLRYDLATQACAVQGSIATATRDIIESQRQGTAEILSYLTNEKISSLQAKNATLEAALSQNAQTATLINALRPTAIPAYLTCSPYQSVYGYPYTANNCGGGCGCGNSCSQI